MTTERANLLVWFRNVFCMTTHFFESVDILAHKILLWGFLLWKCDLWNVTCEKHIEQKSNKGTHTSNESYKIREIICKTPVGYIFDLATERPLRLTSIPWLWACGMVRIWNGTLFEKSLNIDWKSAEITAKQKKTKWTHTKSKDIPGKCNEINIEHGDTDTRLWSMGRWLSKRRW